jgi:hypothetical protein
MQAGLTERALAQNLQSRRTTSELTPQCWSHPAQSSEQLS